MQGAQSLSMNQFWTVRRELALLLKGRAADADSATVASIEQRILSQGTDYYSRYSIDEGHTDWREHARDAAVWLRLNMLDDAGRRLAGTEARHARLLRVIARDAVDAFVDDVGRNLDLQALLRLVDVCEFSFQVAIDPAYQVGGVSVVCERGESNPQSLSATGS